MRDIVGKVKGATDRSVIIGIAIIVLLVIIFGVVRFAGGDKDSNDNLEEVGFSAGDIDVNLEGGVKTTDRSEGNNTALVSGVVPQLAGSSNMMTVRIPVLAGELFDMTSGQKRGCDTLVFVARKVPKSPAVLNATLRELFAFNDDLGFLPGNFISHQEDLSFDRAELNNGVATIYLTGEVDKSAGVCDEGRIGFQLKDAAMQFSTVNQVKVMLNGEEFEV